MLEGYFLTGTKMKKITLNNIYKPFKIILTPLFLALLPKCCISKVISSYFEVRNTPSKITPSSVSFLAFYIDHSYL